jgi:Protein of Unknown function (DUF2784)
MRRSVVSPRSGCSAAGLLISVGAYPGTGVLSLTVSVMWYLIAADLVLVVHLLFIGFVVGGSFLAWRWPRFVLVHLPAMVYGALVEFIGFPCPLTALQNYLLRRGGEAGYRGGFISHYLIQVIYPPGLTRGIQIGLGLIVVLIAAAGYGGYLRRRRPACGWRTGH